MQRKIVTVMAVVVVMLILGVGSATAGEDNCGMWQNIKNEITRRE